MPEAIDRSQTHPSPVRRPHEHALGRARFLTRAAVLGAAVALAMLAPQVATAQLNLYSTLEVDTTSAHFNWYDGKCSLREAILNVNNQGQGGAVLGECEAADGSIGSNIVFDPAVFGGGAAIAFDTGSGPLPAITADYTTVDGWSAGGPGYTGPPLVTLDGSGLADSATPVFGLWLESAGNAVRGLAVVNFYPSSGSVSSGIRVDAADNHLYGNYVGIASDGTTRAGNANGITVSASATGTLIGSDADGINDEAERNVVSTNGYVGIIVRADGATVAGNYVGTDASGLVALGNGTGIEAGGNVVIGGDVAEERNVISGNYTGVTCSFESGDETPVIRGNYVGTDRTGLAGLPNINGVEVTSRTLELGSGFATVRANVVAGNSLRGILIASDCSLLPCELTGRHRVLDNLVGLGADGRTVLSNYRGISLTDSPGNLIRGNYISGNSPTGLKLEGARTTGNMIESNVVGLDRVGHAVSLTSSGIYLQDVPANTIRGNTLSGNALQLYISGGGPDAPGTLVSDNRIGTDPYGNFAAWLSTGVSLGSSWSAVLEHNNVQFCDEAVKLYDSSDVVLRGNLVSENLTSNATALELLGAATVANATDNCIENNSVGVANFTGVTAVLESTWWDDPSGPSGAGPGGGDSVSADVDFDPWLTTRPDCGVRLLFLDDFESADTHYWTSTTP